jgi:hypothetical protein
VIQLGFLDCRVGLIHHVLQGFWYRFLVDAKLREMETVVNQPALADEQRLIIGRLSRQKVV